MKIKDIKIKLVISPELDISGYNILVKEILVGHPLYNQLTESVEVVGEDVRSFYDNNPEIVTQFNKVSERWSEIEEEFLNVSSRIFEEKDICHQDSVRVYPSVWNVGIQNMKEDAVSFPVMSKTIDEMIYVIMHELMHTFFFSYVNNSDFDMSSMEGKKLWDMSEIFNAVVLGLPELKKLYREFVPTNYPDHEERIEEMKEGKGISDFI